MADDYDELAEADDVTQAGDELAEEGGIDVGFEGVADDDDLENQFTDGRYHVSIAAVEDHVAKDSGNPSYKFTLKVLTGDDPKMRSRTIYYYLGKAASAVQQQRLLAVRMGLVGRAVYGKSARINFKDLAGRQCVVKVKSDKTFGPKVDFGGFWNVYHPDVKDVPKDEELLVTEEDFRAELEANNAKAARPAVKPAKAARPPANGPAPKAGGKAAAPPKPAPKGKKKVDWDA